jgi:CheY-like chemotaxis protein
MAAKQVQNVFLADDDKDDIDYLKEAINEICPDKIMLTTAQNGEELLAKLETNAIPDLIILDLNMPILDGIKCLKLIRSMQKYNVVPIIIYSTSKIDSKECFKEGADYYMIKPNNYITITNFVNGICRGVFKDRFSLK